MGRTLARVRSPAGELPLLRLDRLPESAVLDLFEDFLTRVADIGTEVIASGATELLEGPPVVRESALARGTGFHARAFLEPVATALAAAVGVEATSKESGSCATCGSLPVVAVLRDDIDALGGRALVCSLCGTEWRVDRLGCASCGERAADRLTLHAAESTPHVRIDACESCERYIKTVDLRERGDAVPVVDELATLELDLWARDRGLEKIQTNVLEL